MRRLHAGCRCRCCCFYFAMFFVVCACTCAINFWNLSANIFFVACTMHGANAKSWKLAVKHYFWYVNRAWHAIFLLFGHLFKFRNTWMTLATTLTSRFKFLMGRQWEQQLLSLLLLLSFNYSSRCCALNYATKYNANELGAAAQTHTNTHKHAHTFTQSYAHSHKLSTQSEICAHKCLAFYCLPCCGMCDQCACVCVQS